MTALLYALEKAPEVMPDEHGGVAAVGVARDVKPRAGAHRHRCQRCNAATAGGSSASMRDRITRAERARGQASRIWAMDCSAPGRGRGQHALRVAAGELPDGPTSDVDEIPRRS